MKKLMFAAAVAALTSGAFAKEKSPCDYTPEDPVVVTKAWVYSWKFSGKTTVGSPVTTVGTKGYTGNCDYVPGTDGETEVIRIPGSLAIQGYTALCNPECGQFKDMTGRGAWDVFYSTKPAKSSICVVDPFAYDAANVIGKNGKQFEIYGGIKFKLVDWDNEVFDIKFAGLGSYDKSNVRVSSVSGNFVGSAVQPIYSYKGHCYKAIVWECDGATFKRDNDTSVAYGAWSVKYNSAASKNLAAAKAKIYTLPYWVRRVECEI